MLGVLIFIVIWLKSFLLEIREATVCYRTLFGKVQLRIRDIASMRFEVGISDKYPDRLKVRGLQRLVIEPVNKLQVRPIVVNASILGVARVMAFVSDVEAHAGRKLLG
jgi:hypothetical protein